MQLAGHGKDPRLVQVELPIVPSVGDRIREDCNSPNWAHKLPHLIREGVFIESVEKWGKTYWDVRLDNGKEAFFNPKDCEIIERAIAPVLVEKEINQSLPEQEFAVSISGEAIIYDPNAKPIEFKSGDRIKITENRELYDLLNPICNWYSGKRLAMFAVNALGQSLHHAQYGRISTAVELLTDAVMAKVVKPKAEVKALRAFLANFVPSIDAIELPVIADAIATEPIESVAVSCMDEGSASVLVENYDSVLVENGDRYQFLLERREQLIESGASPQGIWINCGKVPHRNFKQAVWKSSNPRPEWGDKKSQYIGKFGGDEHLSAIAQHRAGQELRKIDREIRKLQVKS